MENNNYSPITNFIIGGFATATAITLSYPMDFIKTRMSLQGADNYRSMFKRIVRTENVFMLYKGMSAALLRQLTLSTTRIGVYKSLEDKNFKIYKDSPNYLNDIVITTIAGVAASTIGTPPEVVMNRMAADGMLHLCERRNYKGLIDGIFKITKNEGFLTLWRGGCLGAFRASLITVTQLKTYSISKDIISKQVLVPTEVVSFCASMISGLITSFVISPLDVAKIRFQSMKRIKGVPEHKGTIDIVLKILRKEGITAFTKGFIPDYLKHGPHTVVLLMSLDAYFEAYTFCLNHFWQLK